MDFFDFITSWHQDSLGFISGITTNENFQLLQEFSMNSSDNVSGAGASIFGGGYQPSLNPGQGSNFSIGANSSFPLIALAAVVLLLIFGKK